tara:strand:- start:297 stop:737 length:441 start_codon:yes stop_codon:yes gene_type:complete
MGKMGIGGNVTVEIKTPAGELLQVIKAQNRIPDEGLNYFRDLTGGAVGRPDYQAIGTGSTTPTAADTGLGALVLSKQIDRRIDADKEVTFQTIFLSDEGNDNTISEIGLFYGSILIARALLSPAIEKTSEFELTISHQITFIYEAG